MALDARCDIRKASRLRGSTAACRAAGCGSLLPHMDWSWLEPGSWLAMVNPGTISKRLGLKQALNGGVSRSQVMCLSARVSCDAGRALRTSADLRDTHQPLIAARRS